MGSIILCHKKKAKRPYEIARIQRRIYTIEELCYYICNHLYLVDYTIMNEPLCDWLDQELGFAELAEELRKSIRESDSQEQFIITILAASAIYTAAELKQIQDILTKLKNQKPVEKQKYKADNLLASGAIRQAIVIYQAIINEKSDDSVDKKFYGRVYGCLGTAYGRLFLYEEAARMYEAAYQICEDNSMLKAYLYACSKYMGATEYQVLLNKSSLYQKIHQEVVQAKQDVVQRIQTLLTTDNLEQWKAEYRGTGMGAR